MIVGVARLRAPMTFVQFCHEWRMTAMRPGIGRSRSIVAITKAAIRPDLARMTLSGWLASAPLGATPRPNMADNRPNRFIDTGELAADHRTRR